MLYLGQLGLERGDHFLNRLSRPRISHALRNFRFLYFRELRSVEFVPFLGGLGRNVVAEGPSLLVVDGKQARVAVDLERFAQQRQEDDLLILGREGAYRLEE